MDVTIVIPVKNGADTLESVLEAVFAQKTKYQYEVVCVDSGSSDGSLEIIKKYSCRLFQIKTEEFGHGRTRNFGASQGTGEFIVFLTQDALPASERWLDSFVDAMKTDDKNAGGFGIHYPYPDCNLLDKIMLRNHFRNFGDTTTVFEIEDEERYQTDDGYRGFLSFFSDNNSCLRRSVWEQYPYEDVDFAEDQIWARTVLEHGYRKVYVPDAPVYHSHNFKLTSYLGRCFDEYRALYQINGYKIAETRKQVLRGTLQGIRSDAQMIRCEHIGRREKLKWILYACWRNYCKYLGAYYSVKYFTLDEKQKKRLERRISQQYKQKNKS
jgi:rhamnosyltransferase